MQKGWWVIHNWGDSDCDWNGINAAAEYIYMYLKRWHVPVRDYKEKYGTVRVYTGFGWERGWLMNHLFYPNHMYYRFPHWIRKLDFWVPTHLLNPVLVPFHIWLYKRAYNNALSKWPHLWNEILVCADYPEFLPKHTLQGVEE